jgi:hypothetical protein
VFGKTETKVATATIAVGPPAKTAPVGSLHYNSRGPTLFVMESTGWLRLDRVVLLDQPDNNSRFDTRSRLKGRPS